MEYFRQAKLIRLRTRNNKFLAAGDDGESVKQTRNGHTKNAKWTVEIVDDNPNLIRLRSCYNKLLTATEEPFLLGWTGKKVAQTTQSHNPAAQWEPIRKDFYVMLRVPQSGKFLRANREAPPWKNSVTVDGPDKDETKNWMLWQVDILNAGAGAGACAWPNNSKSMQSVPNNGASNSKRLDVDHGVCAWPNNSKSLQLVNGASTSIYSRGQEPRPSVTASSASDMEEEEDDGDSVWNQSVWSETESEVVDFPTTSASRDYNKPKQSGMELLQNAKTVRLKSHHDKYLVADENQESVSQDKKNGGSRRARWTVEFVKRNSLESMVIRLKSCYDKYLTAIDENYLTGVTGKKVKQTAPSRLDSSLEWEPIREGMQLKLKSRYGNFLRGNGGPPPWRNTVTHDIPNRTKTQDWILWEIDVLEVYEDKDLTNDNDKNKNTEKDENEDVDEDVDEDEDIHLPSHISFKKASALEGRVVNYNVVDDDGNIVEGERSTFFEGKGVEELSKMLEEETGLSHVIVCSRNSVTGKLYPIMLSLPPNRVKLHIYVVPSSSKVAEELCTI